jgi:hypothetical protein
VVRIAPNGAVEKLCLEPWGTEYLRGSGRGTQEGLRDQTGKMSTYLK